MKLRSKIEKLATTLKNKTTKAATKAFKNAKSASLKQKKAITARARALMKEYAPYATAAKKTPKKAPRRAAARA